MTITIALSKGRIFDETLPLLAAAGIVPTENPETSRKLIIETNQPNVRVVIVRATDVPTYVEYGAADLGVAQQRQVVPLRRLDGGELVLWGELKVRPPGALRLQAPREWR